MVGIALYSVIIAGLDLKMRVFVWLFFHMNHIKYTHLIDVKNQDPDIISQWVNIGHGIYIIYLKCFNRQGYNTMKTRGLIDIDERRLCHRWCLIYLCCLVFMSLIVLGASARILNL